MQNQIQWRSEVQTKNQAYRPRHPSNWNSSSRDYLATVYNWQMNTNLKNSCEEVYQIVRVD
jgi:hypothetical protein